MNKIKRYPDDSFEFHNEVLNSKHFRPKDPTYKIRIKDLGPQVKAQFDCHDKEFDNDNLHVLIPCNLTKSEQEDLKSLYDYDSKPFQRLNLILTTRDNGQIQPVCPLCTINNANTLDHQIPKTKFPELSDHPRNLIPCCSECNSYKSDNWLNGLDRRYLNLYIDTLPDKQYLFVNLSLESGTVKVEFSIDNREGLDPVLYKKIENHYGDLKLCKRFANNSYNIISELVNLISGLCSSLSDDDIKNCIEKKECEMRRVYGFNYWKSLLILECCRKDDIFQFLKNPY